MLLHKKPNSIPKIESMFDDHAGEVGPPPSGDDDSRAAQKTGSTESEDYPLLPTRRRFWEACFQAADAAGHP